MNMDRHIFRAKTKDTHEWIYGYYVKHDTVKVCFTTDNSKPKHYIVNDGSCDWGFEPPLQMDEIDPETLGQATGWIDNYNTQIFENDIVEITACSGFKSKYLIWRNRKLNYMDAVLLNDAKFDGVDYYKNYNGYTSFCFTMLNLDSYICDVRVLGNLHDNPELLGDVRCIG